MAISRITYKSINRGAIRLNTNLIFEITFVILVIQFRNLILFLYTTMKYSNPLYNASLFSNSKNNACTLR